MCLQEILFLDPNLPEQCRYVSYTTLTVRNRYIRGGKCLNDSVSSSGVYTKKIVCKACRALHVWDNENSFCTFQKA